MRTNRKRERAGATLVEYALVVAGVALIATAAVSLFGVKTNGLLSGAAAALPGAHADDNAAIQSGRLLETVQHGTGGGLRNEGTIHLDVHRMRGGARLPENLGIPVEMLILESGGSPGAFGR